MDVQGTEVPRKLLLPLRSNVLEVLVPEDDDAALRDQERQLILLAVVELGQLQPADLGPNDGRELGHLEVGVCFFGQEVPVLLVGHQTSVVKLEGLKRGELGFLIIYGEVLGVFVLVSPQG